MKNPIGIVIDGASDLTPEIIQENNIRIVNFKIDFGILQEFTGNIYQRMRASKKAGMVFKPKTSQPSIGDFLSAFKEQLNNFEHVICVTVSSKVSGTYNSAVQAKNFLDEKLKEKVMILDSWNGSGGEGLQVIKILDLIKNGLDAKTIFDKVQKQISKYHIMFAVNDPQWFVNGGRIPQWAASGIKIAQAKGIWPILGSVFGKILPVGAQKGVDNNIDALFKEFESKVIKYKNSGIKIRAIITHCDNVLDAKKLQALINEAKLAEVKFLDYMTEILGAHAGPDTVAISWEEP